MNTYINSRKGIADLIDKKAADNEELNAINDIFTSIYWFQFNLVYGPTFRGDDLG